MSVILLPGRNVVTRLSRPAASGLVALGVVLGTFALSSAPQAGASLARAGHTVLVSGTVSTLGTDTFTVVSGIRSVQISVSSSTHYSDPSVSSPSLSNVIIGESVQVLGQANTGQVVNAFRVTIAPAQRVLLSGVVGQLNSSNFALASGPRSYVVGVSSATTFSEAGTSSPTYSNVVSGESVQVFGTVAIGGTIVASHVTIGAAQRVLFTAKVSSVSASSFTATSGVRTVAVNVTSSTTYVDPKATTPSFADVVTGETIQVLGTISPTISVTATRIWIGVANHFLLSGSISSIGTGSFTLTSGARSYTIAVSSSTSYSLPGISSPTLASFQSGTQVVVFGSRVHDVLTAFHMAAASLQHELVVGKISTIGASSFVITNGVRATTIEVSGSTTYSAPGTSSAGFPGLVVGETVLVGGTLAGGGVLNADHVSIPPAQQVLVAGTVGSVGSNSFTVINGVRTIAVDVSAATHYSQGGSTASPSFASVASGLHVQVFGTVSPSDSVSAIHVSLSSAPTSHALIGIVATVGSSSFTITTPASTLTVEVSSSTTYSDPGVSSPGLSSIVAGESVSVRGTASGTQTITASHVAVVQPAHVSVTGTVTSIGTASFVLTSGVAKVTVEVSSSTTYEEPGVTAASFSNLAVGLKALVVGTENTAHTLDATKVSLRPANSVHIDGKVASVAATSFTITTGAASTVVDVSASTAYAEAGHASVGLSDVIQGERVSIVGTETPAHTLNATRVLIHAPEQLTVSGIVASVGSTSFTVSSGAATVVVNVTGSTIYSDPAVTSPSFATLAIGLKVSAHGIKDATTAALDAAQVAISPPPHASVSGTIASLGTVSFTLTTVTSTQTIDVSSATTYSEPGVSGVSFSSLAVGQKVSVNGVRAVPSTVDASHISISVPPRVSISGDVVTIGSSSFTVASGTSTVTVDVSSSTTFRESGISGPSFSNLAAGGRVTVLGTEGAGNVLDGSTVTIVPPPHVTVAGTVATIGANTFTVASGASTVTVNVGSTTVFSESGVSGAGLANLIVGGTVTVSGTVATGGTISALQVRIAAPRHTTVSGVVASVGTNTFTITSGVATITINVTSATTYTDASFSSPSFANIVTGAHVQVSGTIDPTQAVDASAILIR